jgi:hypothetical protein
MRKEMGRRGVPFNKCEVRRGMGDKLFWNLECSKYSGDGSDGTIRDNVRKKRGDSTETYSEHPPARLSISNIACI